MGESLEQKIQDIFNDLHNISLDLIAQIDEKKLIVQFSKKLEKLFRQIVLSLENVAEKEAEVALFTKNLQSIQLIMQTNDWVRLAEFVDIETRKLVQ